MSRYEPGALVERARTQRGQAITVGCLDVAITPQTDRHVAAEHPVIRVAFGNRCDRAVPVDLTRLTAEGVYEAARVPLRVVDPRREVHPSMIDAHVEAVETFELAPMMPRTPGPSSVCVDVASITPAEVPAGRASRCIVFSARPARPEEGAPP